MAAKIAAQYLLDAIRSHTPDFLEQLTSATLGKKLRGWALKIDVGMRNDGMTLEGCKTAIDAAHRSEDTFWRSNLLSGAALRKQYERLRMRGAKAQRSIAVQTTQTAYSAIADGLDELCRTTR